MQDKPALLLRYDIMPSPFSILLSGLDTFKHIASVNVAKELCSGCLYYMCVYIWCLLMSHHERKKTEKEGE